MRKCHSETPFSYLEIFDCYLFHYLSICMNLYKKPFYT